MEPAQVELAFRTFGGLEVALYWERATGALYVCVADHGADTAFVLNVAAADALDAFYHPYVYVSEQAVPVASRRIDLEAVL